MRVLLISIAFPPKRDPECIQTGRYYKYLRKNADLNISVLTSDRYRTLYMPHDPGAEKKLQPPDQLIELKISENRLVSGFINRFMKSLNQKPDPKADFVKKVKKSIAKLEDHDIIYSRANPISSSIAAYFVKKKFQKPWIMHLSDPWYLSPLHKCRGRVGSFHKQWEAKCLSTADEITFTSRLTIEKYEQVYPHLRDKFHYFPNVYDVDDIEHVKHDSPRKLTIVHTGGMSAGRNPEQFIQALRAMPSAARDEMEVIFAGDADRQSRNLFASNADLITYLGPVPFEKALALQRQSDALLLIDHPFEMPEQAMFFPSKILDYMVAQKHLIAITTPTGTSDQIVRSLGGKSFSHADQEGVIAHLGTLLALKAEGKLTMKSIIPPDEFDASYNADKLASLFGKYA